LGKSKGNFKIFEPTFRILKAYIYFVNTILDISNKNPAERRDF